MPMYQTILVTLDATPSDRVIIDHIKELAKILGSHVVLFHVATGVPARLSGAEAGGEEIEQDKAYLRQVKEEFDTEGISTETLLAFDDPVAEIIKWVEEHTCDLVAMATHGHSYIADLFFGTTACPVQHRISVPMLMLRAK